MPEADSALPGRVRSAFTSARAHYDMRRHLLESGTPRERAEQESQCLADVMIAGPLALDADALFRAPSAEVLSGWARLSVGAGLGHDLAVSLWKTYLQEIGERFPEVMSRCAVNRPFDSMIEIAEGFSSAPSPDWARLVAAVQRPVRDAEQEAALWAEWTMWRNDSSRTPAEASYADAFLRDRAALCQSLAAAVMGPLGACTALARLLPHALHDPAVQASVEQLAHLAGHRGGPALELYRDAAVSGWPAQVQITYLRLTVDAPLRVPGVAVAEAEAAVTALRRQRVATVRTSPPGRRSTGTSVASSREPAGGVAAAAAATVPPRIAPRLPALADRAGGRAAPVVR
jgi:hypothetical protein